MNIRVIFHIQDTSGNPLPNVLLEAQSLHGNWMALTDNHGTFDTGRPEDGFGLTPGDYLIKLSRVGFKDTWIESETKPANLMNPGTVTWAMQSNFSSLLPITKLHREFLINNKTYRPIMCSDFLLIYRFINGENIASVLNQRKSLGFDMVRIFTMAFNIAKFSPKTYDVSRILPQVLDIVHSSGLRAEVEGFADVQLIGLTDTEQQYHHNLCCDTIKTLGSIDLYDLCNEYDKNGINPDDFSQPNGIVSSRGSRQNNKPPKSPYWSFGTYHPRRDGTDYYFSKYRADIGAQSEVYNGVEGEPLMDCPVLPDEPIGFSEIAIDGKRANYPGYAYQIGMFHSIFHNGACFHSDLGINSEYFTGMQLECAKAFIKGCRDARQGW